MCEEYNQYTMWRLLTALILFSTVCTVHAESNLGLSFTDRSAGITIIQDDVDFGIGYGYVSSFDNSSVASVELDIKFRDKISYLMESVIGASYSFGSSELYLNGQYRQNSYKRFDLFVGVQWVPEAPFRFGVFFLPYRYEAFKDKYTGAVIDATSFLSGVKIQGTILLN